MTLDEITRRVRRADKSLRPFPWVRAQHKAGIILEMMGRMEEAAADEEYEKAADLRDRIARLWGDAAPT